MLGHLVPRVAILIAAATLFASPTLAEGLAATVPVAIIGSPSANAEIWDTGHCRTSSAPAVRSAADRVDFHLRPGEPVSIALSDQRTGQVCGGSLYLVPEAGLGYAARLTPGKFCFAELYKIDPNAKPPVLLVRSDNHPQLNQLICATQNGAPGSSRFAAGGTVGAIADVKVEVGADGFCGKFARVHAEQAAGVELRPAVKHWVRLYFRRVVEHPASIPGEPPLWWQDCEVSFAFTPATGAAYFVEYSSNGNRCESRLLRAAAGSLEPAPAEWSEKHCLF